MARVRGRGIESKTVPARALRDGAVQRAAIDRNAVGPDEIRPGSVKGEHLEAQSVEVKHLHTELLPRLVESVPVDQSGAVTVATSNDYPVRVGGSPTFVVTLKTALSSAGQLTFYRNGTSFAVESLPISNTGPITFGPWPVKFSPGDKARVGITSAGAGGDGFHGEWRFA